MLQRIYAIKDTKAGMYNTPFFQPTHGTAERAFMELVRDEKSFVHKYPADYDLYYLGSYDDITGELVSEQSPQHIVSGTQLATGPN